MALSDETKKSIERIVGLPFEDIIKMSPLHEKEYVEKKTGKKLGWREGLKVDGLPIRTIEEVDKQLAEIIEKEER